MIVLHVVAPAEVGGLERVVQMLGTGLLGLGHAVHVVSVVTDPGGAEPFLGPLSEAGVDTHQIVVSARSYARERAAIAALCERRAPMPFIPTAIGPTSSTRVWRGSSASRSLRRRTAS